VYGSSRRRTAVDEAEIERLLSLETFELSFSARTVAFLVKMYEGMGFVKQSHRIGDDGRVWVTFRDPSKSTDPVSS
jgi:hypothetical protein